MFSELMLIITLVNYKNYGSCFIINKSTVCMKFKAKDILNRPCETCLNSFFLHSRILEAYWTGM